MTDIYSTGGTASHISHVKTCRRLLSYWHLPLVPLSAQGISAFGSSLKFGNYRSAALYLSAANRMNERHNNCLPAAWQRALVDAKRSCERGMGTTKKCSALPVERFAELWDGSDPWVPGGAAEPQGLHARGK